MNMTYRPPWSDSEEEDYDGFMFGDDFIKKDRKRFVYEDPLKDLIDIIEAGDAEKFRLNAEQSKWDRKAIIHGNYSILAYACMHGQFDIVKYILTEWKQNANINCHSNTPLVCVCDRKSNENSVAIVEALLEHGAIVDGANSQCQTPLMLACKWGHADVVRVLVPLSRLNSQDSMQCTALFYAVEGNHLEIVKFLLAAGADAFIPNFKGYTPRQLAEDRGFADILDILPQREETYVLPSDFRAYNTLRDYIPQIFLRSQCPEYFPDIVRILTVAGCEHLIEYFARGDVSLAEFLTMDEGKLAELGIRMPLNRKKVLKLLLDFHMNHWKTSRIERVKYSTEESFYDILMLTGNHLHNFVLAQSSVLYVMQNSRNKRFGPVSSEEIQELRKNLQAYLEVVKGTIARVKYLASFSPAQNPLYIDYNVIKAERKRKKLMKIFKYSTMFIGLTIFVGCKVKKMF